MDFNFSDDQEQLRDAVAQVGRQGLRLRAPPRHREGRRLRPRAPTANWPSSAWPASTSPKTHGGMGMGPVEGMVVMEELGRGIVLEPLAPDADRRRRAGRLCAATTLKAAWLPQDRRRRGAGGAGAAGAQGALPARRLRGEGHAGRRRLDASAAPRASCRRATRPTPSWCRPRSTARSRCSWSSARPSGVTTRGYGTQDGGRAAEVTFKAAPATLVTPDGLAALEHAVDIGIAATCAEAVGVHGQDHGASPSST